MNQVHVSIGNTSILVEIYNDQNSFDFNLIHILRQFTYQLYDFAFERKTQKFVRDKKYFVERQLDDKTIFLIPKNYYSKLIQHLNDSCVHVEYHEMEKIPERIIDIEMNPTWKDKNNIQTESIDFLVKNESPVRCLSLQMGDGKSYCADKAAVTLKRPYIIIVSGMLQQWENNVINHTNLTEDEIYVIRGSESIFEIMQNNLKPKCTIASLETIRNFAQGKKEYDNFQYSLQEVFNHLEIGVKIIDEAHLNFHAIMCIDLVCNVDINLYLSATFIRTNSSTNKIFKVIFPNEFRYGEQHRNNYINVLMASYSSNIPEKAYTFGGYSHFRYENLLFRTEKSFRWFWGYALRKPVYELFVKVRKPGQKMLILMGTVKVINGTVQVLKELYPSLNVQPFTSNDPESNLEADIIVSTIGSAGTGRDIKGLITCIDTVSYAAENQVLQTMGRLREIPGQEVWFISVYNGASEAHIRHKQKRALIYKERCRSFDEIKL